MSLTDCSVLMNKKEKLWEVELLRIEISVPVEFPLLLKLCPPAIAASSDSGAGQIDPSVHQRTTPHCFSKHWKNEVISRWSTFNSHVASNRQTHVVPSLLPIANSVKRFNALSLSNLRSKSGSASFVAF